MPKHFTLTIWIFKLEDIRGDLYEEWIQLTPVPIFKHLKRIIQVSLLTDIRSNLVSPKILWDKVSALHKQPQHILTARFMNFTWFLKLLQQKVKHKKV
jgi:hypothetical protein